MNAHAVMFCERCNELLELDFLFCPQCGTELDREKVIITNYFEQGYEYSKIILLLAKFHKLTCASEH